MSGPEREETWLWTALLALGGGTGLALYFWNASARPENLDWLWVQILTMASVPGKYVIFSGLTPGAPMGPVELAVLCVPVDTLIALGLALFLGPLGRLPGIGPWLRGVNLRAQAVLLEYPRLRRMAFAGVALFVFLPLPGTGAMGGMFAAQVIGLPRRTSVLAVAVGTAAIAALFACLAVTIGAQSERILKSPFVVSLCVIVLALCLWGAWNFAKRHLRRP